LKVAAVAIQRIMLVFELAMGSSKLIEFNKLKSESIDFFQVASFILSKSFDLDSESLKLCKRISILIKLPVDIGLPISVLIDVSNKNIHLAD